MLALIGVADFRCMALLAGFSTGFIVGWNELHLKHVTGATVQHYLDASVSGVALKVNDRSLAKGSSRQLVYLESTDFVRHLLRVPFVKPDSFDCPVDEFLVRHRLIRQL